MRALLALLFLVASCGPPKPSPKVLKKLREERILRQMEAIDQAAAPKTQAPTSVAGFSEPALVFPTDILALNALDGFRVVDTPGTQPRTASLKDFLRQRRGAVVAFWATWCVPCIADAELAHLNHLQRSLPSDFPLVSIAANALEAVQTHPKASNWTYPLWQKDEAHIEVLPRVFIEQNGLGLPLFLVLDATGAVLAYRNGALDDAAVRALIQASR